MTEPTPLRPKQAPRGAVLLWPRMADADRRARAASQRSLLALWFALGALVMAGAALASRIVEAMG